ncbi:Putative 3-methyladenine DNA glycosylase [Neolewinella maritima]|uniref:Putative 3-methyladenine DNA glycosylase n=1 Tax=Neolewinella maritima TaxID=1383882 RepID=A0ABM9B3U9_9BACT|nr:DNA-3-methyladenine glycosylase [Neolewinella maritima]CAH1001824.1 Putative 3-methyladenine DNA glycosylase [Neolewinella maritima]
MDLHTLLTGLDPVHIARQLIGQELYTHIDGRETAGLITETEAYWAPDDRASHAYGYRRTPRTEPFYQRAGTSYVYLCYGIHELFNVITGPEGVPHAILIRAIEPTQGVHTMLARRPMESLKPQLSRGPGVVSRILGITRAHNALDLLHPDSPVQLRARPPVPSDELVTTPRIGIAGAGPEWAAKPWRFYRKGSRYVSRLNAFQ